MHVKAFLTELGKRAKHTRERGVVATPRASGDGGGGNAREIIDEESTAESESRLKRRGVPPPIPKLFSDKETLKIQGFIAHEEYTLHEPPQYDDTQDMMLRLANDAQHDVRPAKTASGASDRAGGRPAWP